jgi:hypothetical protein
MTATTKVTTEDKTVITTGDKVVVTTGDKVVVTIEVGAGNGGFDRLILLRCIRLIFSTITKDSIFDLDNSA